VIPISKISDFFLNLISIALVLSRLVSYSTMQDKKNNTKKQMPPLLRP